MLISFGGRAAGGEKDAFGVKTEHNCHNKGGNLPGKEKVVCFITVSFQDVFWTEH